MVHPTQALIPQLSFGFRHFPETAWCAATQTFRAVTLGPEARAEMEAESSRKGKAWRAATTTVVVPKPQPPHPHHTSLSANAYPLPPSVGYAGQRMKQLNNTLPPSPDIKTATAVESSVRSSLPAPTVWWNDHLRML